MQRVGSIDGPIVSSADAKFFSFFFFSQAPDLTLIKRVNDETTLSETRLIRAIV